MGEAEAEGGSQRQTLSRERGAGGSEEASGRDVDRAVLLVKSWPTEENGSE